MSGAGEESLDANQTMAASAAHNQTGTRQRGPGLPQEADLTTPWPPTCTRQEMWHPDPGGTVVFTSFTTDIFCNKQKFGCVSTNLWTF